MPTRCVHPADPVSLWSRVQRAGSAVGLLAPAATQLEVRGHGGICAGGTSAPGTGQSGSLIKLFQQMDRSHCDVVVEAS